MSQKVKVKGREIEIPDDFNWEFYLKLNPDVRRGGFSTRDLAILHYDMWGKKENRKYILIEKHFEVPFTPPVVNTTPQPEPPLYIFYHIGAIDEICVDIVKEQIDLLTKSGLYQKADRIFYSIVGSQEIILPEKFECIYKSDTYIVAEMPMLEFILRLSKQLKFKCIYFHTKGAGLNVVKTTTKAQAIEWRKYMGYFNIELWEKNIKLLDTYDTVGTSYKAARHWYGNHYSGNFWWSKSSYISTLDSVYNVVIKNQTVPERFKAEMWILQNPNVKPFNYVVINTDEKTLKDFNYRAIV